MVKAVQADFSKLWDSVREQLKSHGIEIDTACCSGEPGDGTKVKVVCVAPGVKDCVDELTKSSRDQVVMVRVDEQTSQALDAWVETGAVKSRSEAAALFIQEGLKVRATELDQLRDALRGVEDAKRKLREKAREVLGEK